MDTKQVIDRFRIFHDGPSTQEVSKGLYKFQALINNSKLSFINFSLALKRKQ